MKFHCKMESFFSLYNVRQLDKTNNILYVGEKLCRSQGNRMSTLQGSYVADGDSISSLKTTFVLSLLCLSTLL